MKKAFTTIELIVAIALMAMVMIICSSVFKLAINAQRQAGAITEITRNFRAISGQIDKDFAGMVKDGFLILRCNKVKAYLNQKDLDNATSNTIDVRRDNMIFFSVGDFSSIKNPDNKSNVSLIYYGPEDDVLAISATNANNPVNKICPEWVLVRAPKMLLPNATNSNDPNSDYFKASITTYTSNMAWAKNILRDDLDGYSYDKLWYVAEDDEDTIWKYFAKGVGSIKIQWSYGTVKTTDNSIAWMGLDSAVGDPNNPNNIDPNFASDCKTAINEDTSTAELYTAQWGPEDGKYWPRAIKFTMTLYDSKGIIPEGKVFTHIVYIGN